MPNFSGIENYDPAAVNAAGTAEAQRGMQRQRDGQNVVGMAGSTGICGEDGPIFSNLTGYEDAQEFGRLHDVQAAMAERASGGGTMFTIANVATAAVGGLGTLATGDAHTGAAMADGLFGMLGYPTGDYARVQGDVANGN
jgi:hypothetical protein